MCRFLLNSVIYDSDTAQVKYLGITFFKQLRLSTCMDDTATKLFRFYVQNCLCMFSLPQKLVLERKFCL